MALLTLASGITIRDKGACRSCGAAFFRRDRVRPVWVVAGTTRHPKTNKTVIVLQSRTDMAAPQNEYIHHRCNDARLDDVARIVTAERPPPMDNLPDIEPRGDDAHCVACRKLFARGDRVTFVYAVQGVGRDPETQALAAQCSGMYESLHVDCKDPKLEFGQAADALISQ